MSWLRNRHAHDLSVTGYGGPKKGMFSGPGVITISPNNRWKASKEVLVGHDRSSHLRLDYDSHVAGFPVEDTLGAALVWFGRVLQASDIDPNEPHGTDESVM